MTLCKRLLLIGVGLVLVAGMLPLGAQQQSTMSEDEVRWALVRSSLFGDVPISSDKQVISVTAPARAMDASVVPVTIKALIPQDPSHYIKKLHLLVDKNPIPLAGVFEFQPEAGGWVTIETRLRINEFTFIRGIAEMNDGSLHMAKSFIKAAGGCSAPGIGDLEKAMSRAGRMRLNLRRTDLAGITDTAEATLKISHPNNSGMQYDQVNKRYIPAFFVHTIGAQLGDKDIIKITTNFSMSENPTVRFGFRPDAQTRALKVYAIDSAQKRYEHEIEVRAPNG